MIRFVHGHSVRPVRLYHTALLLIVFPMGCSKELLAQSKEDALDGNAAIAASSSVAPSAMATSQFDGTRGRPEATGSTVNHNGTLTNPDVASPSNHMESPKSDEARCREQPPQDFLVRAHINRAPKNRAELLEQRRLRRESIAYRTKHYGYVKGFGDPEDNTRSPRAMSARTTFFDRPIVLNRRIIPALRCVEERLKSDCASTPYTPTILSGLRQKNTYFDGEVSNHVYGIAIDIDPEKNPCCKCVSPWNTSERCQGERTAWERMSMPRCWVEVFERLGFYWLGHDVLEDTMHFEFLGDPDRIGN